MSELANFPFLNQLTDGDVNNEFDCVPTCIAACLTYLTGRPYSGAALKDAVYGRAYQGPTAAGAYVAACAQAGVTLTAVACGSPQDAVMQAHVLLARGLPVIFTQVDDYSPNPAYTHVCVWYKEASGGLSAMDPFGGKDVFFSDGTWAVRLRSTELWMMEKQAMTTIPQGWKDDGAVLTAPNGKQAMQGMRARIINDPTWNPRNLIEQEETHMDQLEVSNPAFGGGQQMVCTFSMHAWKPETGVVDEYIGREILALRAQNAMLQAQVHALQRQLVSANNQAQVNDLKVKLNQIHTISTLS